MATTFYLICLSQLILITYGCKLGTRQCFKPLSEESVLDNLFHAIKSLDLNHTETTDIFNGPNYRLILKINNLKVSISNSTDGLLNITVPSHVAYIDEWTYDYVNFQFDQVINQAKSFHAPQILLQFYLPKSETIFRKTFAYNGYSLHYGITQVPSKLKQKISFEESIKSLLSSEINRDVLINLLQSAIGEFLISSLDPICEGELSEVFNPQAHHKNIKIKRFLFFINPFLREN